MTLQTTTRQTRDCLQAIAASHVASTARVGVSAPRMRTAAWLLTAAICLIPAAAWSQSGNTAFGTNALISNTTGSNNSAFGQDALRFNSEGPDNTAVGYAALYSNTVGAGNTASGRYALFSNTFGGFNTATGRDALYSNTVGSYNTATGRAALYSNTTGSFNGAAGRSALFSNTTGSNNVASGYFALFSNTTGNDNTAVGYEALRNLGAGSNNIALGVGAGKLTTSGNNNVYIGHPGINGAESRSIRIGRNNLHLKTFVAGISGTAISGATVVVNPSGRLGVIASSARYKTDVKPIAEASHDVAAKLAKLRPVTYRYRSEPDATHYGLIAEEVAKVMPEVVVRDEQQRPETVQYIELIPLLVQQWKAQQAENTALRAEIAELRRLVSRRHAALERD